MLILIGYLLAALGLYQLKGASGGPDVQAIVRIFGMTFFQLLEAQIYAFEEVANWLTTSGFRMPRRINLTRNPGISLVVASKES